MFWWLISVLIITQLFPNLIEFAPFIISEICIPTSRQNLFIFVKWQLEMEISLYWTQMIDIVGDSEFNKVYYVYLNDKTKKGLSVLLSYMNHSVYYFS